MPTVDDFIRSTSGDYGVGYLGDAWTSLKQGDVLGTVENGVSAGASAITGVLNRIIVDTTGLNPLAGMNALARAAKAITNNSIVPYQQWPGNEGFLGGFHVTVMARKGLVFSRIGNLSGAFAAPPGTSLSQRGLPANYPNKNETRWVVEKEFFMAAGIAASWQDAAGGGLQYLLPVSVQDLWDNHFIHPAP